MATIHFTPYSTEKNLAKAYNDCFTHLNDEDFACIRDGDTCFLTPDWGEIIETYAKENPGVVLTCYTNRLHPLASEQLLNGVVSTDYDMGHHVKIATDIKKRLYSTTEVKSHVSALLMLIPKSIWKDNQFEEGGLLGVDTRFYRKLRERGKKVLRMNGLYIFHSYRLWTSLTDKTHLL